MGAHGRAEGMGSLFWCGEQPFIFSPESCSIPSRCAMKTPPLQGAWQPFSYLRSPASILRALLLWQPLAGAVSSNLQSIAGSRQGSWRGKGCSTPDLKAGNLEAIPVCSSVAVCSFLPPLWDLWLGSSHQPDFLGTEALAAPCISPC